MGISIPLKRPEPRDDVEHMDRAQDEETPELRNWVVVGIGSYGVNMGLMRAYVAFHTRRMDFLGCFVADSEKIDLKPVKGIARGWLGRLFKRGDSPHFRAWQLTLDQMGMEGDIQKALNRLDESSRTVKRLVEAIRSDTSEHGNRVGLYISDNNGSGGNNITSGLLTECMLTLNRTIRIDKKIESTVLPVEADRIKFENRKITLASQLARGLPGRDIVILTDNNMARGGMDTRALDFLNAILMEALKNGISLTGDNDTGDRINTLKNNGNRFVLPAAMSRDVPVRVKGIRKKEQLLGRVLDTVIRDGLETLCSQSGFREYGLVRARDTSPVFLVIAGDVPRDIAQSAAESTALPEDVSTLYLPTSSFGRKVILGVFHVTKRSIDSIDRIYGIESNGTRPAPSPENLLPRDILEEYSEKTFPNTKVTYPMVYRRVARICDCDLGDVMEVV